MRNMRPTFLSLVALLAIAAALFTVAGATQARAAPDLTGVWEGSDGGTWYITEIGTSFWMYGEGSANNPAWATVVHGTISGDMIKGAYSTVPKGKITEHGPVNYKIVSDNELHLREGLDLYR